MMNAFYRLMPLGLLLLAGGCANSPYWINEDYEKNVSNEELNETLDDWYFCDECVGGELRRVQELGDTAVNSLGPIVTNDSMPDTSDVEDEFEASCERILNHLNGRNIDPGFTVAQCVQRFNGNLDRRLRYRSIEALLAIRTEEACRVLGAQELGVSRCLEIPAFPPMPAPPGVSRSTRIYDP